MERTRAHLRPAGDLPPPDSIVATPVAAFYVLLIYLTGWTLCPGFVFATGHDFIARRSAARAGPLWIRPRAGKSKHRDPTDEARGALLVSARRLSA